MRNSDASSNNYNDFEGEGIGVGDNRIVQNNTAIENHSSAAVLMNPEGRVHGALAPPLLTEPLARDLRLIAAD